MIVGVPRELKQDEYRVGLLPVGVELLVRDGHTVLLEAAAYGRCLLAADIPENKAPLGNCAIYFTMDSLDELKAQIQRCLRQADTRRDYGRMARMRARELSVSSQVDQMEGLYGQVLRRNVRVN